MDADGATERQLTNKKKGLVIAGAVFLVIIIILSTFYSDLLGAKVAPGKKFKILGPSSLQAGTLATITWDISTQDAKKYPYEKIEYCYGKQPKPKCVLLATAARNNGKAIVKVPASLPVTRGALKFTARTPQKQLVPTFVVLSNTITTKKASSTPTPQEESGGGGGGSGSGGSSDGDGDSGSTPAVQSTTPLPTTTPQVRAEFLSPLDDELFTVGDPIDVQVQLSETNVTKLSCQQWFLDGVPLTGTQWDNGQSPDLSGETCQ